MNTLKPWQAANAGTQWLTNDAISTEFCRYEPRRSTRVRMFSQVSAPSVPTVSISYTELKDQSADLSGKIEQGFGPNGLGILSISEVPGYTSLRRNLLQLAPRLANLPEAVKKELEDPYSRYGRSFLDYSSLHTFYWLLGTWYPADMLKGSFYANPILDVPTTDLSHVESFTFLVMLMFLRDSFFDLFHVRDEKLRFPKDVSIHEFMVPDECISFGDYTEKLLDKYYELK
ncbi:hypothetical protein F511_00913 [Dorcoceras hygrometricum]|nr:hypothetical protein F511_00913 [Dorcoceras hygrometricum]